MLLIIGIVLIRHAPLVAGKDRTGLQDAVNFGIHPHSIGRVARRLDGIRGIVARILERHAHEVALHRSALLRSQLRVSLAELVAPVDLILVQSEARNIGAGEFANVAHGAADATSDVHYLEIGCRRRKTELAGQIMLVAADGFAKVLMRVTEGKVKRLPPAPLVKEGGEVVV